MMGKWIKRSIVMLAVGMLVLACGCGTGKAEDSGTEEKVWTEEASGSRNGESADTESKESSGKEQNESAIGGDERSSVEENTESTEEGSIGENEEKKIGREEDNGTIWDDTEGEGIKTIHGTVKSLEDEGFRIVQAMTGTDGGKGEVMVMAASGYEEDSDLITVKYNENLEFVVETTTDGRTSTEREGSREELEEGSSVIITGSWEGEIFRADKVVKFIVDM